MEEKREYKISFNNNAPKWVNIVVGLMLGFALLAYIVMIMLICFNEILQM